MTVDLSDFERSKRPGGKCKFPVILNELEESDREKLAAALKSPDIAHVGIERWLRDRGYEYIKYNSVLRHRNGHCACA